VNRDQRRQLCILPIHVLLRETDIRYRDQFAFASASLDPMGSSSRIRKLMLVESGLDSSSGPPEHDRTGGLAGKSHGTCSKSGLDG
jgi:hypothetical protein